MKVPAWRAFVGSSLSSQGIQNSPKSQRIRFGESVADEKDRVRLRQVGFGLLPEGSRLTSANCAFRRPGVAIAILVSLDLRSFNGSSADWIFPSRSSQSTPP